MAKQSTEQTTVKPHVPTDKGDLSIPEGANPNVITFRQLGPEKLDNNTPQLFQGFYRGALGCPPAYGEEKLGPVIRLFFLTYDGRLVHDVVRPGNQYVTTVHAPTYAQIRVLGKKRAYQTFWEIGDKKVDDVLYQNALALCRGFDGSAPLSEIWGQPRCIDLDPAPPNAIRADMICAFHADLVKAGVLPALKPGEQPPRRLLTA